jgi:hypothetical protein
VRKSPKEQRLDDLESEFRPLLVSCLEACAGGRGGLFNHHPEASRWLRWPEADHLKQVAREIHTLRQEFGQPSRIVERFLDYCSLQGASVLGETKLAAGFLKELNDG